MAIFTFLALITGTVVAAVAAALAMPGDSRRSRQNFGHSRQNFGNSSPNQYNPNSSLTGAGRQVNSVRQTKSVPADVKETQRQIDRYVKRGGADVAKPPGLKIFNNDEMYLPNIKKLPGNYYIEARVGQARENDQAGLAGKRRVVSHYNSSNMLVASYYTKNHYNDQGDKRKLAFQQFKP